MAGVTVASIPETDRTKSALQDANWINVRVDKFLDARDPSPADSAGRKAISVRGDVGSPVQEALQKRLKNMGARLSLFDVPVIRGEVSAWYVLLGTGFPVELEGVATLAVEVADQEGHVLYRATYGGNAYGTYPFPAQGNIQTLLETTMGYAIDEALADKKLLQRLNTGR